MVLIQTFPSNLRGRAHAAALALLAAAATPTVTSAESVHGGSAVIDSCSYLSDTAASAALGESARHARISNDLCIYRAPGGSGPFAFVSVATGKASALGRFAEFLRAAGDRSQAIARVGDVAYTIGPNVITLRGDTLIVTSIREPGASLAALQTESIEVARGAADSGIAMSSTCDKDSHRVRDAAR